MPSSGFSIAQTPKTASAPIVAVHLSPSSVSTIGSAAPLKNAPIGKVTSATSRSTVRNDARQSSPRSRIRANVGNVTCVIGSAIPM